VYHVSGVLFFLLDSLWLIKNMHIFRCIRWIYLLHIHYKTTNLKQRRLALFYT